MFTPLVSVCMTTYNHEPYLREAIESVLAQQTSFDVELVLGEDCSTDLTRSICEEYVARYPQRVRLVTGAQNVGWRANYLRTFEACRGKYIAYCDGDDWWSNPHKLQMQADLLESDPACGLCYTRTQRFYQQTALYTPFPPQVYADFAHMVFSNPVDNCCSLARRELIARYYAEVRPDQHPEWKTDDAPMWLWFSLHSQIGFIDEVTAVHRVLTASVSHSAEYRKRIEFLDSMCDIGEWFDLRYGSGKLRFRLRHQKFSIALWVLSFNGSIGEYAARWWRDVRCTPRLAFSLVGYGLLVKKILFRRNSKTQ